ncbi:AzlD domain-containing protein [Streptomyces brasiliensis]|uniref:Branched-chain amino acid transporter n=1 Tax=Streptomyces brasiliensis TaxID=1954 RepID=A0A917LAS2_9ACTN|nr:AzlD domain-containing protein [Streptomyces brasiliensis]GGJ57068.1 branched-chain amino acid transporter [Streptomyces brasiliensis]
MNGTFAVILALAVGTYAFRLVGPVLHGRAEIPARVQELAAAGAMALLTALLATGALTEAGGFAGWARPAGVLVGAALAWRRAPFAVVVLGTAGVLRLLGVG